MAHPPAAPGTLTDQCRGLLQRLLCDRPDLGTVELEEDVGSEREVSIRGER